MWEKHAGASGITDILNDAFGADPRRSAVQNALAAAGGALQAERDDIAESLGEAPNLKADETTYGFLHEDGCAWIVIGGDSVVVHTSSSRAGAVMDSVAPYRDKPLTCDGYSGYSKFATKQRCWAHILRESGALARTHGKAAPELAALHDSLALLYHDAKNKRRDPGGGPAADTGPMEAAAANAIEARSGLHAAGRTFATKLANAAPFPFTFVNRPGGSDQQRVRTHAEEGGHNQKDQVQDRQHGGLQDVLKHNDLHADMEEAEPQRVGHAAEGLERNLTNNVATPRAMKGLFVNRN